MPSKFEQLKQKWFRKKEIKPDEPIEIHNQEFLALFQELRPEEIEVSGMPSVHNDVGLWKLTFKNKESKSVFTIVSVVDYGQERTIINDIFEMGYLVGSRDNRMVYVKPKEKKAK